MPCDGIPPFEHFGRVTEILDAFAPLVHRPCALALGPGGAMVAPASLTVEALE